MKTIFKTVDVKSIESLSLTANRWIDSMGNTYHSCYLSAVLKGDSFYTDLAQETFNYGYDRQYEQTALELFKESVKGVNLDNKDFISYLSSVCKGLDLPLSVSVHDVKRKKDL